MAKRCLIETCKREAETYCYHCSRNVCTKHYLEHKSWIQDQLHPLVDEMNLVYDRLRHDDKKTTTSVPQCWTTAWNLLDKWREDCHHRIDLTYDRVRIQVETIVEKYKVEETEKVSKNLDSLEKLRQKLNELLKEGDMTYRQLETMKQQLEEIKKKEQEPLKYPDIRIVSQKLEIEKCISVVTDLKQQQSKLSLNK